MAGLEPSSSEDDVSKNQVFRRRVLLLLGPLVTPFIARWWWIEFGAPATLGLLIIKNGLLTWLTTWFTKAMCLTLAAAQVFHLAQTGECEERSHACALALRSMHSQGGADALAWLT